MQELKGNYAPFPKRRSPPVPQEDVDDLEDNKSMIWKRENQKMQNLPRYWRKVVRLQQIRLSRSGYTERGLSKRAGNDILRYNLGLTGNPLGAHASGPLPSLAYINSNQ